MSAPDPTAHRNPPGGDPAAADPAAADPALRAAVRDAGCGVFFLDDALRVRRANAAFVRFAGRSEEELARTAIAEIDPGWPHGEPVDAFEALREEVSAGHATRLRRPDGSTLPVQMHLSSLSFGGLESLFGVVVDTSERQAAEDALERSEDRFRTVTEQLTEFVVRFRPDDDRTVTFCNPALARLVDLGEPAEVVGRPMPDFVHPDDRARVLAAVAGLTPGRPIAECENRVFGPNGEVLWTRWVNRGLFSDPAAGGEPPALTEVQAVGRDVTARVEAERRLAESERRLRAVLDDMSEMVIRWRPADDRIVFANAAYRDSRRLPGADPGDPDGVRLDLFAGLAEADVERIKRRLSELTPEDPGGRFLLHVTLPDGSRRWEDWTGRAIFADGSDGGGPAGADDPAGPRVVEYQSVGLDVTAEVLAERRREAAAAELAKLSPRERQVLAAVAEGTTNKVIARRLEITERTVEKHRGAAMRKLGVRSSAELVRAAIAAEKAPDPADADRPGPA